MPLRITHGELATVLNEQDFKPCLKWAKFQMGKRLKWESLKRLKILNGQNFLYEWAKFQTFVPFFWYNSFEILFKISNVRTILSSCSHLLIPIYAEL